MLLAACCYIRSKHTSPATTASITDPYNYLFVESHSPEIQVPVKVHFSI